MKYVFVDVVGFTKGRSVEAQSDIVHHLNLIVRESISAHDISPDHLIVIPSGDGLCLSLLDFPGPFDIHLVLALDILKRLKEYNRATSDEMRRFHIRVGVNENVDNVIVDFNGQQNVAGVGISMAQRIMDLADGGQILVGETVYQTLNHREKYLNAFRKYRATGKHGLTFNVYQYILAWEEGLNTEPPEIFTFEEAVEPCLPLLLVYYLAQAVKYQNFLASKVKDENFRNTAVALLYFLARDCEEKAQAPFLKPQRRFFSGAKGEIKDMYEFCQELNDSIISELSNLVVSTYLSPYDSYFLTLDGIRAYAFVNDQGREKVKQDWPEIWQEFFSG